MTTRLKVHAAIQTDRGAIREFNEDSGLVRVSPSGNRALLAVADGTGGQDRGKFASQLVIDTVSSELDDFLGSFDESHQLSKSELVERLRAVVAEANHRLYQHYLQGRRAGSTAAFALIQNNLAVIAVVEDCWVYLRRDNNLELLINVKPFQYGVFRKGNPYPWRSLAPDGGYHAWLGTEPEIRMAWWERAKEGDFELADPYVRDLVGRSLRKRDDAEFKDLTRYINRGVTRLKKLNRLLIRQRMIWGYRLNFALNNCRPAIDCCYVRMVYGMT